MGLPPGGQNPCRKNTWTLFSACCFTVKGYEPANYSGKKTQSHCLRKDKSCWDRMVPTHASPLQHCETVIQTWQRCLSLMPVSKHKYSSWTTLLCHLGATDSGDLAASLSQTSHSFPSPTRATVQTSQAGFWHRHRHAELSTFNIIMNCYCNWRAHSYCELQ